MSDECLCRAFWVCTIIVVVALFPLYKIFQTVTMTPSGPHFYINEFYVPALDLSQHTASNNNNNQTVVTNPCLFFDLAFVNIMLKQTVHYGDVNITLSHGRKAVASYVVPAFIQEHRGVEYRREVVEGVPWESTEKAVSNGSTVVFRVDLATVVTFHSLNTKKKDVRIGADVEVDGTGLKLKREDIRLDSAASRRGVGIFVLFLSLLVTRPCS
ncbi:hypothetical protein MIMGU_mgv1a024087mg [Erythranthe guttata]|uniref:Late embryogenesis abundant protein LEA-2 subgroup domain-containing protein n=1 Tax=Erythranthe guttata TaxID=4155 RepID=A0A022QCA5_ERYGU|nr:hypothetical protein MIMGU_mgv1a024087mg [Erythranthe guttata]